MCNSTSLSLSDAGGIDARPLACPVSEVQQFDALLFAVQAIQVIAAAMHEQELKCFLAVNTIRLAVFPRSRFARNSPGNTTSDSQQRRGEEWSIGR